MNDPLETAVGVAVRTLIAEHGPMDAAAAHATLWPYVRRAMSELAPASAAPAAEPARDRRVRRWQYVVRFWDGSGELVAETDPEVMEGTGNVPHILASLAQQLHGFVPWELHVEAVKARLPQLRNNLGRMSRATLRIAHADGSGAPFVCLVDIHRLGE